VIYIKVTLNYNKMFKYFAHNLYKITYLIIILIFKKSYSQSTIIQNAIGKVGIIQVNKYNYKYKLIHT
jgi:hypothetical protein